MSKACSIPQARDPGQRDGAVGMACLHPGLAIVAVVEDRNREVRRALHADRRERAQPH
jgi:hypothetical protein